MSESSITYGEDRADLVYITKLINVDDFGLLVEAPKKEESVTTIGSDVTNKPTESEIKLLNEISGARLSKKLKPFHISYAYGINANVGVINLTQGTRRELIFSSVNSVIIYDYCTKKTKHLQAHPSTVNSISIDANGEYLVSTDEDRDGCLIVWCCKSLNPLFNIYKPYPEGGIIMAALSGCARFLVTMGDTIEYYSIDVWLWTFAEEKPHDTYLVHKTHGKPVRISFHPDNDEHIMVVFETQVFFLTWHLEESKLRPTIIPQIYQTNYKIGEMTCGTYMKYSHSSYVSTSTGCILLFRNTLYTQEYEEGPLRNKKMYINAVKVTKSRINYITATPNRILVTGDSRGTILFFDRRIRLLFWIKNPRVGSITAISFALTPKTYSFVNSKVVVKYVPEVTDQILECEYKDMEKEITDLIDTPKDVSMDNNPFLLSDFFISTADSNIYAYDFIRSMATPLFHKADASITCIDAHDERPYIVIGFENGRITLINYETKQTVSTHVLPKTKQTKKGGNSVSCIKYSRRGLHLVCGRQNGEIWILDPSILQPRKTEPFQKGRNQVMKIDFAYNAMQFAYYDDNRTVIIFNYNSEKTSWEFRGKIRSHSLPIHDMMFFSTNRNRRSKLFTIGADRYMLQYNNWALKNNDKKPFIITARERIEQSAMPMNFTAYCRKFGNSKTVDYLLFADNKHKIKMMHAKTKTPRSLTVAPSSECFKDAQVRKMRIVPFPTYSRYMVFMTEKHLGILILPPDGNPFRNVGYMVHPKQVRDFVLSRDGKQVFTFGQDDTCVLQWQLEPKSVELAAVMGGAELEPYYSFLDGGRSGYFVQEVEELFYYIQSLQQENFDVPRKISDCVNLSEVPHLAKACGFFPSNFELEIMMLDIRFRDYDEDGQIKDEVSFVEFMKLLINHMPYDGYSVEEITEHFETLCSMADNPRRNKIDRNDFVTLIQTECEGFRNMHGFLTRLLGVVEFGPGNYNFLPTSITKQYLIDKILGLETENPQEDNDDDDNDLDETDYFVRSLRRMIEEDVKTSSKSSSLSVRRPRYVSESNQTTDLIEVNIFDNPEAFENETNDIADDTPNLSPFGPFQHILTKELRSNSSVTSSGTGSTNLIKFESDYSSDSLERSTAANMTTTWTKLLNKNLLEETVIKSPIYSIMDEAIDEIKGMNGNTNPMILSCKNWIDYGELSDTNPFKPYVKQISNEPDLIQEEKDSEQQSPVTISAPISSAMSQVSDESDYKSFDVKSPEHAGSEASIPPRSSCSNYRTDDETEKKERSPDNMSSVSVKSRISVHAAEFKPKLQHPQPQYTQWSSGNCYPSQQYYPPQPCYPPQQPYPQQPYPQHPYPQHPHPQQPYPQHPHPQQPYPQHPHPQQPYPQQQGMMGNGVYAQSPLISPPSSTYGMVRPHVRPPPGFNQPVAYYQNEEFKYEDFWEDSWYNDFEQQQQQMQSSPRYNMMPQMMLQALSATEQKDFYDFFNERLKEKQMQMSENRPQ